MAQQKIDITVTEHHGRSPRGLDSVPRSASYDGRFGRLFRNLAPFDVNTDDLRRLAVTMIEKAVDVEKDDGSLSNNDRIPAGFTYLGQFIDHDLTFDPNSKLQRDNDPDGLRNFRTPRFDLDSLYGRGPADEPFLYADGRHLLVGKNATNEPDLPRNDNGRAITGDPRNDENLIVSQLHLAFLQFHNAVLDELGAGFEDARTMVRWHYQWIVLRDFLRHVVGDELVNSILVRDEYEVAAAVAPGPKGKVTLKDASVWNAHLKFFKWKQQPFMPVEFSVAAYRFGHSMVRGDYALNPQTSADEGGEEVPIFDPTQPDNNDADDLRGFRRRPKDRKIEWNRFFNFKPTGKEDDKLQPARAIDTLLVAGLGGLPTNVAPPDTAPNLPFGNLAFRNLLRGQSLGLPSGQAVARAMGIPESLIVSANNPKFKFSVGPTYKLANGKPDPSVPDISKDEKKFLEGRFGEETPLWYYILKEAELICQGRTLGPVGGRIAAEVFIGLLAADPFSFLNVAPDWQPTKGRFGCPADGQYDMATLLKFVQSKNK
ncbi:MAG TPA: heme peroxidase family protein [Blastocatellia bacterium]|nr:heme peroxidase family protein [Blastocatellia bacterium]